MSNDMNAYHKELGVFSLLAFRLEMARKKHPTYARSAAEACDVIKEELLELYQAVENESESRQLDEAVDVAVTAIRFILEEYK